MRNCFLCLALLLACCQSKAAVLPAEKLLPKDTALVFTMPDAVKSWTAFINSSYGRLWDDPSMKPFRDKFVAKLQSNLAGPIEQQLGIKLSDYRGFVQGQFTFAMLQDDSKGTPVFSELLLIDSKDQAPKLKAALADAKKKWVDAGKPIKTEQIRGVEFNTFITSSTELSNAWVKMFPESKTFESKGDSESKESSDKIEIVVGQSDSLLLVSDSTKSVEKVLTRQAGGLIPALEEDPSFQADYAARLHGAPVYLWVNSKNLFGKLFSPAEAADEKSSFPQKLMTGAGLGDVKTVDIIWRDTPDGLLTQFFVGVPEANRRGLFKLLAIQPQDANPPPFVPADAVKFARWRLDLPKTWTTLEEMLDAISPSAKGAISLILESAGKDKDEKYDFRSELISSLGNDVIMYQKAPRSSSLADLSSPPSLYLIGSPKPERLALVFKVAGELFLQGATVKDSDFLGRKLYKVTPAGKTDASLSFAATGSYVAFSSDLATLEEYLRSSENKPKPLSETPGLSEAAQKVGGMSTGLFGFSNQKEDLRVAFETLRKNSGNVDALAKSASLADKGQVEGMKALNVWADFSLLPPFDAVSKYFTCAVYAGAYSADGLTVTFFSPNPPPVTETPKQ